MKPCDTKAVNYFEYLQKYYESYPQDIFMIFLCFLRKNDVIHISTLITMNINNYYLYNYFL